MLAIKWPREQRQLILERIQAYYEQERGESLGSIAAEQIADAMISIIGPFVYNQAVADARAVLHERLLSVEDELYSLEKRTDRLQS